MMISIKGRLFIISAPSGTGKGSVIKEILEQKPELVYSISATTRKPRKGEKEGIDYYFVSHEIFEKMIAENEFFEYAQYVGEYYGTPKKFILECIENGKDVILEVEVQGARQVMAADPNAVSIFISPPNMQELARRLQDRGTDSEDARAARLKRAEQEMEETFVYDHIVINESVKKAAEDILGIINNRCPV
jgi:guanylate kinase